MSGFIVTIPTPPSVNSLFGNRAKGRAGKGRFVTKKYRAWRVEAGKELMTQRRKLTPVSGAYRIYITLPKIRGDADNRSKAVLDLLVSHGLTDDDRHCRSVHVEVIPEHKSAFAVVSVEAA